MTILIQPLTSESEYTRAGITLEIDGKYGFEIRLMRSGSVYVWRTVNGKACGIQRMSRSFTDIQTACSAYKKLAPHTAEVLKALGV